MKMRWKILIGVGVVVILLVVLVQALLFAFPPNKYRQQIADEIQRQTGLTAEIGDLDFNLFPRPRFQATSFKVHEKDLSLGIDNLDVTVKLLPLLTKTISISALSIDQIQGTVPATQEELLQQLEAIQARLNASTEGPATEGSSDSGGSGWAIRLDEVSIPAISITQAGQPYITGNLNALQDNLKWQLALDGLSKDATLEGALIVRINSKSTALNGDINIANLDLGTIAAAAKAPSFKLNLDINLEGSYPKSLLIAISGDSQSDTNPELAGPLEAALALNNGDIHLDTLTWQAEAIAINAKAAMTAQGLSCEAPEIRILPVGLKALAAPMAATGLQLHVADDALFSVKDLVITSTNGSTNLQQGDIALNGLTVKDAKGNMLVGNLALDSQLAENALNIATLSGSGFAFQGRSTLDLAQARANIDMTGEADLAKMGIAALAGPDKMKDLRGTLTFTEMHATLGGPDLIPPDLKINATLKNAGVTLITPGLTEKITDLQADIQTDAESIRINTSATGSTLGAVAWKGRYTLADANILGTLRADIGGILETFAPEGTAKPYMTSVGRGYGDSTFDITAELPTAAKPGAAVSFKRQGDILLEGAVKTGADGSLQLARAKTEIQSVWLKDALGDTATFDGSILIDALYDPNQPIVEATLSLTDAALGMPPYIQKQKGDTLQATVRGTVIEKPITIEANILGQILNAQIINLSSAKSESFTWDLSPLSRLMAQGGTAGGRITGSFDSAVPAATITFDNASFAPAPEIAIDRINGTVRYNTDTLVCEELVIQGADSDCTVQANWKPGAPWTAEVTGKQLNLNPILAIVDSMNPPAEEGSPLAETPDAAVNEEDQTLKPLPPGKLNVQLGQVVMRRGRLNDLKMQVTVEHNTVVVDPFSVRTYEGGASGILAYRQDITTQKGLLDTDISLTNFDMRVLDEMLYEKSKNVHGQVNGIVDLAMPVGSGIKPYMDVSGTVDLTAIKGSFGTMKTATKILTFFRLFEVFQRKGVVTKDEGLVFDKFIAKAAANQGVVQLQQVNVDNSLFLVKSKGTIDFPQDKMNVTASVHPLQTVKGVVDFVPILGEKVVGTVNQVAGYSVKLTGSPFAPKVNYLPLPSGEGIGNVAGNAGDAAGAAGETVVDVGSAVGETTKDVAEEATKVIKGLFGGRKKTE